MLYVKSSRNDGQQQYGFILTNSLTITHTKMPIAQTRLETLQVCKLLQCVREKVKEQIQKMTTNGVPHLINYNDPAEGHTALSVAACANDDDMIEFLLDLGAHPDVVDFKGRSAAMRAAEYGHVHCLEKLVEKGASMKTADLEGKGKKRDPE
jgi:hypothetical protein